jgi:hypothetical protein
VGERFVQIFAGVLEVMKQKSELLLSDGMSSIFRRTEVRVCCLVSWE